jgi:hypothetical protein
MCTSAHPTIISHPPVVGSPAEVPRHTRPGLVPTGDGSRTPRDTGWVWPDNVHETGVSSRCAVWVLHRGREAEHVERNSTKDWSRPDARFLFTFKIRVAASPPLCFEPQPWPGWLTSSPRRSRRATQALRPDREPPSLAQRTSNAYTSRIHSCCVAPEAALRLGSVRSTTKRSRETCRVGSAKTASASHSRPPL